MSTRDKNIPLRMVVHGESYIRESEHHALQQKHARQLEQLAQERIMLNPELHQVQKDRLELKKLAREMRGNIKRPLWKLPPKTQQDLRMLFYEIHDGESRVKQRFDDAIAKPKPSRWRQEPDFP